MAEELALKLAESIIGILGSYVVDKIKSAWKAKEELEKLKNSLNLICPFIRDAERKLSSAGAGSTDEQGNEGIETWLKELKGVMYDVEDLLDEAATNHKMGCFYSSTSKKQKVRYLLRLSGEVKALRGRLDEIAANSKYIGLIAGCCVHTGSAPPQASDHRIRFSSPFINTANFQGRKRIKSTIMKVVLGNRVEYSSSHGLSAVAVVGTGGLGKTTLTQMIYSDPRIDEKFDIKLWGYVSHPFNLKSVLKRILGSIDIDIYSDDAELMMRKIAREVQGKRYFLVLDDVWTRNREEWKPLMDVFACGGTKGGVILVTTRDHEAAKRIGIERRFDLRPIPFDVCMSIFREYAFGGSVESYKFPRLMKAGKIIVRKCNGLPLAVEAVGSMLRFERDEEVWDRVAGSDLWEQQHDVFAALRLSYNVLPSRLKACFAYLSVIPKGNTLYTIKVINMWAAHGLLPPDEGDAGEKWHDLGERYLKELLSRSLLQEPLFTDNILLSFKMHDHIHQLAVDVMGDELATVSCNDDPKVSNFVRHIILNDKDLSATEVNVPKGLLPNAHQVRTLAFARTMPSINKISIKQLISSFKCLRYLNLSRVNFDKLPDLIGELKHLRCLLLYYNLLLKALPDSLCKLINLQTLDFRGCYQIEKLPDDMGKLMNLTHLVITLSDQNKYLIPKRRMVVIQPSIQILQIQDCMKLVSLLEEEDKDDDDDVSENIRYLMKLRVMVIINCPEFNPLLSNSLLYLTSLNRLVIQDCGERTLPPPQPPTAQVGGMVPGGLRNLKHLHIVRMPTLVSLPDVLKTAATSLRFLKLVGCDSLKSLPEWLRKFKSLRLLHICDCPKLSTLPSDGFRGLASLQELEINGCPGLSLRCSNMDRKYWPRISHIYLDGRRINVQEESRMTQNEGMTPIGNRSRINVQEESRTTQNEGMTRRGNRSRINVQEESRTTQNEGMTRIGNRSLSGVDIRLLLTIFAVLIMVIYWETVVYVFKYFCLLLLFLFLFLLVVISAEPGTGHEAG